MSEYQDKLHFAFYGLFSVIGLIIMADFLIAGNFLVEDIAQIRKERQQYYNAARNFHYAYKVSTRSHEFYISGDHAEGIEANEKIEYEVSVIFDEVNAYRLPGIAESHTYSMRYLSGLLIPLLVLITIAFAYFSKKKMSTLVFVLQVLLLADLVFLIL